MTPDDIKEELTRRGFKDATEAIYAAYPGMSTVEKFGQCFAPVPWGTPKIGFIPDVVESKPFLRCHYSFEKGTWRSKDGMRRVGYRVYGSIDNAGSTMIVVEEVDAVKPEYRL